MDVAMVSWSDDGTPLWASDAPHSWLMVNSQYLVNMVKINAIFDGHLSSE